MVTPRRGSQTSILLERDPGLPEHGREGHEDPSTEAVICQQTYIGSILLSVNPYQMFGIYGPEQVQQYSGRALGDNPP